MPESEPEVEIVCPRCGYRMTRTPARLRRGVPVVCPQCGADIVHSSETSNKAPDR